MSDKTGVIFGNVMDVRVIKKATKAKASYVAKFGDDNSRILGVRLSVTPVLGDRFGMKTIMVAPMAEGYEKHVVFPSGEKPLVIGTIRMGYGHFRISMAIASAARSMGFTPYWFDMHSFADTTAGKIIRHINNLYSLGSRLSQKFTLFNSLYWEPLNSEGFRKLSYNAVDQKVSELMASVCRMLDPDVPFVATHVWPAQAAIHAGMTRVVNVIPDNWPMALHLAEGSLHAVQTPFAWLGYRTLNGMDKTRDLLPMPEGTLVNTGHYIDHEMMKDLSAHCDARIERRKAGAPLRLLLSIGGAGAQKDYVLALFKEMQAELQNGKLLLWINTGDHQGVRDAIKSGMEALGLQVKSHSDYNESGIFNPAQGGHHLFCHQGIMEAVYMTNLLIPICDVLLTKPSELAFYPVPKLLIKRIGGHEAWGAIRSSDIGDGTYEINSPIQAAYYLRMMMYGTEILGNMNASIKVAADAGTYNGAYKVVELATKRNNHD